MNTQGILKRLEKIAARGGIIVFFIIAFEVMIMISPFAFFFYSVFNPVFHWLDRYAATRWLTGFFLPHMILPPTLFLRVVRISGSVFFVMGLVTFAVCAGQVYLGKFLRLGVADKGLYRIIRHPQYLALGLWGIGMTILWPRFLVLVTLSVMFILYHFLAKEEERRMLSRYGDIYRDYRQRTGMFLPRRIEVRISFPSSSSQARGIFNGVAVAMAVPVVVVGTGFLLRLITLHSLPFRTNGNVTLVSILPEDAGLSEKTVAEIARAESSATFDFLHADQDYLGYLMPADYVMQGMIANTGAEFHLHKQQHTVALITDWVLHPFAHLRRSPSAQMAKMHGADPDMARRHHCPLGIDDPSFRCDACPFRRVIFVEIDHAGGGRFSNEQLLSFATSRVPVCFIDINVVTGEIVNAKRVEKSTAWKDVPTPAI